MPLLYFIIDGAEVSEHCTFPNELVANLKIQRIVRQRHPFLTDEWRNTFYVCAEEWGEHFEDTKWSEPELPKTPVSTTNRFWECVKSKKVHETALRIMDTYLIYNTFPKPKEQQDLVNSLVIVNGKLGTGKIVVSPTDQPEVRVLLNIYGVLLARARSANGHSQ